MKWLFQFILSHSIFISFCAAALALQTLQLLSLPANQYLLGFIFFATLAGYNAYWMVSRFSFNTKSFTLREFLKSSSSAALVLLVAVAGMLFCITKLQLVMYNIIFTFILLVCYTVPVFPSKELHFTRKAGFLKTILLAFTWTTVTTLIPLQISIADMESAAQLIFLSRFFFMLMLCIIFDKRDVEIDKIRGLQSLATTTTPAVLHLLAGVIIICYLVVVYLLHSFDISTSQVTALMLSGFVTMIVYIISLKKRGYLFYYFLVDGLMLFSALLTCLASI